MTPQPAAYKSPQSLNTRSVVHRPQALPAPGGASSAECHTGVEPLEQAAFADTTFGMPAERQARLAARRAFVALKLSFQYVVDRLTDKPELQKHVRLAEEPHQLWALRASVFAALTGEDPHHRSHRQLLNRSLETMFPMDVHRLN